MDVYNSFASIAVEQNYICPKINDSDDFIIKNGEMHHKHRYTNHFKLSAHFYGEDITDDEKKTAKDIIESNAENFHGEFNGVYFYKSKDELKGLELWQLHWLTQVLK